MPRFYHGPAALERVKLDSRRRKGDTRAMKPNKPVNVRRSDVMEKVSAVIGEHYLSPLVDGIRARGGRMVLDNMTILLAQEFGFCAGVRRAIDIAYAARRVFPDRRIFLIGEIIHNPEVNRQLDEMGLVRLPSVVHNPLSH